MVDKTVRLTDQERQVRAGPSLCVCVCVCARARAHELLGLINHHHHTADGTIMIVAALSSRILRRMQSWDRDWHAPPMCSLAPLMC